MAHNHIVYLPVSSFSIGLWIISPWYQETIIKNKLRMNLVYAIQKRMRSQRKQFLRAVELTNSSIIVSVICFVTMRHGALRLDAK